MHITYAGAFEYPGFESVEPSWIHREKLCEPETALVLNDGTILVSNVCDFATQGTGYISRLGSDGSLLAARFIDALDSPLGMAMHGQKLLVVDKNTVRCFELGSAKANLPKTNSHETNPSETSSLALSLTTPCGQVILPTSVANDIAVSDSGEVYVTDTVQGKVYSYSHGKAEPPAVIVAEFPGANGIAVDGNVLWVGGERLWRYTLSTGDMLTVGPDWLGDIDGIELEPTGAVQVTPVDGPVIRLVEGQVESVRGVVGAGSANHGYSTHTQQAIIPTGFDNTVVAFEIPLTPDLRH